MAVREVHMHSLEWDENLSVGVSRFDKHHRYLFTLLEKNYVAWTGNAKAEEIEPLVDELIDYAVYYFTEEELLMKEYAFPGLPAHEQRQVQFIQRMFGFQRDVLHRKKMAVTELAELMESLGNLLKSYITDVAKQYGVYLNSIGMY
jgi:hemerythrin-like metal-binding protein